jgi:hypothetical protein
VVSGQQPGRLRWADALAVLPLQYGVPEPERVFSGWRRTSAIWWKPGTAVEANRMSQQPETTTSTLAAPPVPTPGPAAESAPGSVPASPAAVHAASAPPQRIPRWLERAELFLRVLLRMYIGLAICYAPWSRMFWDRNPLFLQFPTLSIYAANGAVRGIVSGVGLLNLWIAFQEAIRRRDE